MNKRTVLRPSTPPEPGSLLGPQCSARILEQAAELERCLCQPMGQPLLANVACQLFGAGGKRLRALFSLAISDALDVQPSRATRLAEVIELTHGATLLHDDVIDEASHRRGIPAARVQWSNTLSVLGGDYVLVRAIRLVHSLGKSEVFDLFLQTLGQLVEAEAAQHVAKSTFDISSAGYTTIAGGKTGALFAFAAAAPAHLADRPELTDALATFGRELGIAFQIADDIRDLDGHDPSKPPNLDLQDGVLSLPLRLAAQRDGRFQQALRDTVAKAPNGTELLRIARWSRELAANSMAAEIARAHLGRAHRALVTRSGPGDWTTVDALTCWLARQLDPPEDSSPPT